MIVTDVKRTTKGGKEVKGYYMDKWLKQNLDLVPFFLEKKFDVVGIVSGSGLVGVGKSTIASQICYYVAWLKAGGKVIEDEKGRVVKIIKPTKKVKFSLKENAVFSAEDLQDRAISLYKKYEAGQVILYDEGRQGLDSSRAMESINKGMEDFFQECRYMGHVIIIVLPNFFKLHEDYAVARSIFLLDAFLDQSYNRGYFNFYNRLQKERLFYFGKKKIGVTARYNSAKESFWGKFINWMPFDEDEYEKAKREALEKKRLSRSDRKIRLQRDILVWYLYKELKIPLEDIKDILLRLGDVEMGLKTLQNIISKINEVKTRAMGYV